MITVIRKQLKISAHRFVLWVIIIAIAIGFIAPTVLRRTTGAGPWAIKVNNEEIPHQEFIREVNEQQNRLAFFRAEYGQIADLLLQSMGISVEPKTLAFNQLVKEELLNQFAQKIGIYLHPIYIMQKMNDQQFVRQHLSHVIPPFLFDNMGMINEKAIGMFLKKQGLTSSMFERSVERALTNQFVMELVNAMSYVPQFDIKQQYIKDSANKKFSLLLFAFSDFLKKEKESKVTDKALTSFFEKQNKRFKRYWVPEKRGGIRWKFSPQSYGTVVTQEEVSTYYEDNKIKNFVGEPTKVEVRQIVIKDPEKVSLEVLQEELLKNPASFEEKAKEFSQDPESAKNGGLIAPFARGQKENAFERAAFLLKKDGAISPIIKTNEGEVLLQRVKKIPQSYKPLAHVESDIKKILQEQKFQKEFTDDMKLIIEANDRETLLKDLVAKKGGKPDKIDLKAKDDTQLTQTLFRLKKDAIDFYMDDNVGIAVQLTSVQEQYLPNLETIKSVVIDDLYEEKATEALQKQVKKVKKLVKNKQFMSLAEEFALEKEETGWIKPKNAESKNMLKSRGLPVSQIMQLDSVGMIREEKVGNDKYLIRLDEIQTPTIELDSEQWEKAKNEVSSSRTNLYKEAFVASLFRPAKIKTNESVVLTNEEYSI
ncbi:MAG: peptidylprolyl isomerase [Candidatus Babeliales bacterium]